MTTRDTNIAIHISNLKIGYTSSHEESGFSRDGISFTARKGEMVALIGPNGAGKSTLLRTICGFHKILAGNCSYYGFPLEGFSPKELAGMISFVSTENVRVTNMSVASLVAYGRFPYTNWLGKLSDADHYKVKDALDKAGLNHLANKMVTHISDGERQRAYIARAVAQDTPVIILDEPTSFLDVSNKYEIFHLLHQLAHHDGKTIVLSTHDMNIALREMDKLWLMPESENLEGAPEDAVLNGWINRLFSNSRIGFDAADGDFFFIKETAGMAQVKGNGLPYTLTVRALERKGYQISQEGPADTDISVVQDGPSGKIHWELVKDGMTSRFSSIYSLMAEL